MKLASAHTVCVALPLLLLSLLQTSAAVETRHFKQWYPAYGYILDEAVHEHCEELLGEYIAGSSPKCDGTKPTCLSNLVVSCILENVDENLKAKMAAASVVLGLLPSVMGLTASDVTEIGILAQHRPLLCILLTLGAPVLSPMRTFEFINPIRAMQEADEAMPLPELTGIKAVAISLLHYVLATAAAANLMQLGWELGIQAVCSFAPDSIYLPLLWTLAALLINGVGSWAVRLRLKMKLVNTSESPQPPKSRSRWMKWTRMLRREGQLCMSQPPRDAEPQPKSYTFIFALWFTSTLIIIHLVFGTLVLSSTQFVSTTDALLVAGRFLASMIVCRAIVIFEINGIKTNMYRGNWNELVEARSRPV